MPKIIPSTDLRNKFAEVEKMAKDSKEPIYLTKNGRGSLVLMDIDAFEEYQADRAWCRYVDSALAQTDADLASGASMYQSMEIAFEELLTDDSDDADKTTPRNRHAIA